MDYNSQITDFEREKKEIIKRLSPIDLKRFTLLDNAIQNMRELASLDLNGNGSNGSEPKYNQPENGQVKITWNFKLERKDKVKRLLKEAGRYAHIQELVAIAKKYYDPEMTKANISSVLTSLSKIKNPEIEFYQLKQQGSLSLGVWGCKAWKDDNGQIKPEKMYSEEAKKILKLE